MYKSEMELTVSVGDSIACIIQFNAFSSDFIASQKTGLFFKHFQVPIVNQSRMFRLNPKIHAIFPFQIKKECIQKTIENTVKKFNATFFIRWFGRRLLPGLQIKIFCSQKRRKFTNEDEWNLQKPDFIPRRNWRKNENVQSSHLNTDAELSRKNCKFGEI